MSTRSSWGKLIKRAQETPGFWERRAVLGFIDGIDRLLKLEGIKRRAELARMAKMDEATLSRALSGKQNVTIATMSKIAKGLGAAVHVHVEKRGVRGGWVPVERIKTDSEAGASDTSPPYPVDLPRGHRIEDVQAAAGASE